MTGLILVLMSNVCYLAITLVFLVVTWQLLLVTQWLMLVTARYLVVTGSYCSLLVVTTCSCSLLLIPTFSMNEHIAIFYKVTKGGSRDFEKVWRSLPTTMVGQRRKFQVSDNNVRNYKFFAKYCISLRYFQIFSIFIHSESMPMKSYQFFKIYKRLYKKRDKIHIVLNEI